MEGLKAELEKVNGELLLARDEAALFRSQLESASREQETAGNVTDGEDKDGEVEALRRRVDELTAELDGQVNGGANGRDNGEEVEALRQRVDELTAVIDALRAENIARSHVTSPDKDKENQSARAEANGNQSEDVPGDSMLELRGAVAFGCLEMCCRL
jgi:polyhydroxyalkanoate synthesis regulator phasin